MADRLAHGDLTVRVGDTGMGTVGTLQRSFNTMAETWIRSRAELTKLVDEQAALRRVATLVARHGQPAEVFAAVTEQAGRLLNVDGMTMLRYLPDGGITVVGSWGMLQGKIAVGSSMHGPLGEGSVSGLVWITRRSARIDDYGSAAGPGAEMARATGIRSAVGVPVMVGGRLWGVMTAQSVRGQLPLGIGDKFTDFVDLAATAVANADSMTKLAASRARIVAVADQTRQRIERNLHDGIQQRLVSLMLDMRATEASVPPEWRANVSQVADALDGIVDEVREFARGIHPAVLSEGGLAPALKMLARRSPCPVHLDVDVPHRPPSTVEVASYYVVAEALTNTAKHAQASTVWITALAGDGRLHLSIRDDGRGGADPSAGTGLVGLRDRVEALGGSITVVSPPGRGTSLEIELPTAAAP